MAHTNPDRVKETSTTTGTGTYDLAGAEAGFQGFVAGCGDGNTVDYCAEDGTDWEVGIGTVTDATPDTLARTTILASSNGGSAVNWGAGTKRLFAIETRSPRKLGTIVASNDATIDFTGLTGEYKLYTLRVINAVPATDGVNPYVRISVSSSFQSGAGAYGYSYSSQGAGAGSTSATEIQLSGTVGSAAGEGLACGVQLHDPADNTIWQNVTWQGLRTTPAGAPIDLCGGGAYKTAAVVDGIQFLFSSGNVESGTFILYGWN